MADRLAVRPLLFLKVPTAYTKNQTCRRRKGLEAAAPSALQLSRRRMMHPYRWAAFTTSLNSKRPLYAAKASWGFTFENKKFGTGVLPTSLAISL